MFFLLHYLKSIPPPPGDQSAKKMGQNAISPDILKCPKFRTNKMQQINQPLKESARPSVGQSHKREIIIRDLNTAKIFSKSENFLSKYISKTTNRTRKFYIKQVEEFKKKSMKQEHKIPNGPNRHIDLSQCERIRSFSIWSPFKTSPTTLKRN